MGLIRLFGSQPLVKQQNMFYYVRYYFKHHGQVYELVRNIQDFFLFIEHYSNNRNGDLGFTIARHFLPIHGRLLVT